MNSTFLRILSITALSTLMTACGGPSDYAPADNLTAETIFAEACMSCHGVAGEGKIGLFKLQNSELGLDEIAAKITEGGMLMPQFVKLSETQRAELANYVKSL